MKVLVANRGEIALRIIRACSELSVASVAVYSSDDVSSPHTVAADEAVELPGDDPGRTYNNAEAIIAAARDTGATAVHPGYGFLAENAEFARLVEEAGLKFIGPSPVTLSLLADKTESAKAARSAALPLLPKSENLSSPEQVRTAAEKTGFPLLVKSPFGGGGLGCHPAFDEQQLEQAYLKTSSQGKNLYGSPLVFVERFLDRARHIEVQTFGDGSGRVVHAGTRECSIQRRRQKVIEEAPAQNLSTSLEKKICASALALARSIRLRSAATVEFLVRDDEFFFLEVNPRIQVEHPVTELVYGIDLVQAQMLLAMDEGLSIDENASPRGYACEARIYAEDPLSFMPAPGTVDFLRLPGGPGVRVDCGIEEGCEISGRYDPLLAKLSVWARGKDAAIARMRRALSEFAINGTLTTNIPLLAAVVNSDWFRSGRYDTGTLEKFSPCFEVDDEVLRAVMKAAVIMDERPEAAAPAGRPDGAGLSWWNKSTWGGLP